MVAVIGVPDELRGEAIVAYVVPAAGVTGSEELAAEIQDFVKQRLAFYQYPRDVIFSTSFPPPTPERSAEHNCARNTVADPSPSTP